MKHCIELTCHYARLTVFLCFYFSLQQSLGKKISSPLLQKPPKIAWFNPKNYQPPIIFKKKKEYCTSVAYILFVVRTSLRRWFCSSGAYQKWKCKTYVLDLSDGCSRSLLAHNVKSVWKLPQDKLFSVVRWLPFSVNFKYLVHAWARQGLFR